VSEATGHTTEQRLLRSTFAAYAIQFARLGISFGAKIALARLILPEGHGLYELALRIVTVASAVRDLGLPYHLVRDKRRPYGTVLASTTFLGILITLVLIAAAPVFGGLNPDLPLVLRFFAVWVLLDGLSVVPKAFFERELTIGRLVGPEIARGFVIAAVSVLLAWRGWGVWSFVIADLAAALLYGAWSWTRAWGKVPLRADLSLLPELIRKSSYLFWIWIVIQLVTYIDAFIIAVFRDTEEVGLYARTYMLVFLVPTIVYPRALFPSLVEYLDDRPRFLEVFRLSAIQLLGCQVIASYFLFLNAHRVILIFGEEWLPAVPILQALAFIPFFDQFSMMGGEMLKARHEDRPWLIIMVINLISLVGFGIYLTDRFGAPGMAAANYLLVGNLLMAWRIKDIFGPRFWGLMGDLALLYVVPLPFFALAAWLCPPESWSRFAASILAAALAAGTLVLRYQRPFREFFGRR
jgi:O-antigen/teichoic acid export membrane protein